MTRKLMTVAALIAFACATSNNAKTRQPKVLETHGRYSSEAGATPVGSIPDAMLRDAKRGKDIELTIDYPTSAGAHPLIIFSHGYGGTGRGYVGLSAHWASNGYVVIKPTHRDASRLADLGAADFRERIADIQVILDSIPTLEQNYPELKGKIDATKIGVGGHSLGALTAMQIGGLKTFPGPKSYSDPRVKAIIAMSPQGPRDSWGLTNESWSDLKVPAMFMTGDKDHGIEESETPEWRRQAFELSPNGDKWLVFIAGAGHLAFTGRLGVMPEEQQRRPLPMYDPNDPYGTRQTNDRSQRGPMMGDSVRVVSGTIKALSLAFWDAYLRGDAEGRTQLEKAGERSGVELKKK